MLKPVFNDEDSKILFHPQIQRFKRFSSSYVVSSFNDAEKSLMMTSE